jgi:hypothetical protein
LKDRFSKELPTADIMNGKMRNEIKKERLKKRKETEKKIE